MIATIAGVLRGEGFASAARRARERASELARDLALRSAALVARGREAAILNVSAASIAPRTGGVAIQLAARLRAERELRPVALLEPRGLHLPSHIRSRPADLHAAIRQALALTGAQAVHFEGTSELPLAVAQRLIEERIPTLLTIHDFTLLSSPDRAGARNLVQRARAVVFPSGFLRDQYRDLVGAGHVIEPAVPAARVQRSDDESNAVAFAGAVKPHKGGALLPGIAKKLEALGIDLHVFGGGDVDLLRPLRRMRNVIVHGYYRAGTLPGLLARYGIGLVVLPSIVPESYSITLTEAWLAGAAVAAFDLGAPGERLRKDGGGWLAPLESGVDGLVSIVDDWVGRDIRTRVPPVTASPRAAADAHLALYRECGLL